MILTIFGQTECQRGFLIRPIAHENVREHGRYKTSRSLCLEIDFSGIGRRPLLRYDAPMSGTEVRSTEASAPLAG